MNPLKVTLLMPALNEEDSIEKTLLAVPREAITQRGFELEIVVVDGKSADNTAKIAQKNGAIVFTCERGYGRQYRYGFGKAGGDIIVTADSDGSYPLEEMPRLLDMLLEKNLDFISTNRFFGMRKGSMKTLNFFGNKFLTMLVNVLFSLHLKDSQSGMWIFRRPVLERISLSSNGMPFSQEIKIEAFKKVRAYEADSSYYKRIGKTKLSVVKDGWGNAKHLLKKRFQREKSIN